MNVSRVLPHTQRTDRGLIWNAYIAWISIGGRVKNKVDFETHLN